MTRSVKISVRATINRARGAWAVHLPLDKLATLRNHPVFREFPPAVIEHLGAYMTRRTVPQGAMIFAKGDPGTTLMAVLSGSVRISVPAGDGHEAVLNIIKPGQVFGEVALLDCRARTADAVAMTDCELMVIDRRDFIPLLNREPDVALKLIEILCARIRRTSAQVEDVMYLSLPARLAKAVLAQLAQFGVGFCYFTRSGVSRIKGLWSADGGFGHVVPTLGIFWKRRVGFDWAHVPAPHNDTEGREGSPLLAARAQRACRATRHSTDGGASWRAR